MALWTFQDEITAVRDFCGNRLGGDEELRKIKRAIFEALRDLARQHRWTYYTRFKPIVLNAAYSTGTIQYTNSTLTVTLTGGTFPTWAALGSIVIANVTYKVASRTDGTHLVLSSSGGNPGADVAAGTAYRLYQDSYVLPANMLAIESVMSQTRKYTISPLHPRQWALHERSFITPGSTAFYCIMGDPNYQGRSAMRIGPPSSASDSLDVLMHTAPITPLIDDHSSSSPGGTVSVTSGSAVVTGSSTSWDNTLLGTCFRIYKDASQVPTGPDGRYPFVSERVVTAVGSATSLTVDTPFTSTLSGVAFRISDILDVDQIVMLDAFRDGVKAKLAKELNFDAEERQVLEAAYREEMIRAMEADVKTVNWATAGEVPAGRWKFQAPYETGP